LDSEQVILDVDSQREICCHTAGSIAFGPDDLLYLSTGDNTTPFDEKGAKYVSKGFAPLNDIPGKEQYDARRSSGNTNDLRGKILRIKINEDGSYDIPKGNLFPIGTENTRPEIYTMGHRNPYRISVDPKKGYLYWGDVGPDAGKDDIASRGPRGYDEMNQAREAGNFGWPLFIGNNKPYWDYDYTNGESGVVFDPAKPINDSKTILDCKNYHRPREPMCTTLMPRLRISRKWEQGVGMPWQDQHTIQICILTGADYLHILMAKSLFTIGCGVG